MPAIPSRSGGNEDVEPWDDECPTNNEVPRELRKVNGCISAADPQIYELLGETGKSFVGNRLASRHLPHIVALPTPVSL